MGAQHRTRKQPSPEQNSPSRLMRLLAVGGALVGAIWLALKIWMPSVEPPVVILRKAQTALDRGEFGAAEQFAVWIEPDDPLGPQSRLIAGEAATRAGRLKAAVYHYQMIPRDGSRRSVVAAHAMGELFRAVGQLTAAEEQYAYVLKHDPSHISGRQRMAFLLNVTGRKWQAVPHVMWLIQAQSWELNDLIVLGDPERHIDQTEYLEKCLANAPDDLLVRLALASHIAADGDAREAIPALEAIVAAKPERVAAQAMLGELLVGGEEQAFVRWHSRLPEAADSHPEIWYVRGLWWHRQNDARAAARCFWETLRRAPEHRQACYQLGQTLHRLGDSAAGPTSERAGQLVELAQHLESIYYADGRNEARVRRVVQLLEDAGRLWEAWAWAITAMQRHPQARWPKEEAARLRHQLTANLPRTIPDANLALQYDASLYDLPEQLLAGGSPHHDGSTFEKEKTALHFEEETAVGIDFIYHNGSDETTKGARQFEQTGGGVAVLDYDGDGWPDLFLSQGGEWTAGKDRPRPLPQYRDHLYRNLDGQFFMEVGQQAGLEGLDFGQGVSAGDFNNDGFPDLYVANIGRNRLYQNNGDGTFSEVTDRGGITDESWTSSCVIADVNDDGLPDLYDVNYLTGPQIYQRICDGRVCSPKLFTGDPDQLLLNRGDGSFTPIAGPTVPVEGKGLGVVAARLEGDSSLRLFVANDQVANFLLKFSPSSDEQGGRLEDQALPRGLAFSSDGQPLSCMGIAADDVDRDGRLDFMVTNFRDEPNNLYLQDSPGFFVDAAQTAGLHAVGFPFVGWGTQFLDADLDGHVDLVVTNGHVDDYREENIPFHMPPQFFRNSGDGTFAQLTAGEAGDFFERKFLGRGLARLDWNDDGRMDFAVSNMGAPFSLVSNRSENAGHFFNVRLRGTTASRDAIGTQVEVSADGEHWTKQLVAGDGYMASNERFLQFGLGSATSVNSLRVRWSSGESAAFAALPADSTLVVVEGAGHATLRRNGEPPVSVKSH